MSITDTIVGPSTSYAPFPSTIRFNPSETSGFYLLGGLEVGIAFAGGDAKCNQLGLSTTTN